MNTKLAIIIAIASVVLFILLVTDRTSENKNKLVYDHAKTYSTDRF